MKLAREIVRKHYPEMPNDYSGRRVSIVLDAIQATEARAQGLVELLEMVDSIEYKELNLSNYTHDDVCALNNVYVEMQLILTQALATWRRT